MESVIRQCNPKHKIGKILIIISYFIKIIYSKIYIIKQIWIIYFNILLGLKWQGQIINDKQILKIFLKIFSKIIF